MKVYLSGNYLTLENENGTKFRNHAKHVSVKVDNQDGDYLFTFNKVIGFYDNPVKFSEITKGDGTAYATVDELLTFLDTETGMAEALMMTESAYTALENKENKLYYVI